MASNNVPPRSVAAELGDLLESVEIRDLIDNLQETRWTGRPGYPIKVMVGMALAKSMYALPTWAKFVRLVHEHAGLQAAIGCVGDVPSQWACYRFAKKLRENGDMLDACISCVIAELHRRLSDYGRTSRSTRRTCRRTRTGSGTCRRMAPSASASPTRMRAGAIGRRSRRARAAGFYGYKLQAAVCTAAGLPVAWGVASARANESTFVAVLIDSAKARGFAVETCAMDKAYDITRVYTECTERDCQPITPLRKTGAVVRGEHLPPSCEHGPWRFAGSDYRRGAAKWRCPTGDCTPASTWIKADRLHPLILRETLRFRGLYRRRAAIEREFGRLKHDWALLPLRVCGIDRVRLHADLTILTKLPARWIVCGCGRGRSRVKVA